MFYLFILNAIYIYILYKIFIILFIRYVYQIVF